MFQQVARLEHKVRGRSFARGLSLPVTLDNNERKQTMNKRQYSVLATRAPFQRWVKAVKTWSIDMKDI